MGEPITEVEFDCLVSFSDPNNYDDWLKVGDALYTRYNGSAAGFSAWCKWSMRASNYDALPLRDRWGSFSKAAAPKFRPVADQVLRAMTILGPIKINGRALEDSVSTQFFAALIHQVVTVVQQPVPPRKTGDVVLLETVRRVEDAKRIHLSDMIDAGPPHAVPVVRDLPPAAPRNNFAKWAAFNFGTVFGGVTTLICVWIFR